MDQSSGQQDEARSRHRPATRAIAGPALRVRIASAADAPLLARLRVAMSVETGALPETSPELTTILEAGERCFVETIASGECASWIAEDEAGPIGAGSAQIQRLLPCAAAPSGGVQAFLVHFYTVPAVRRRGAARAVMIECLAWCRGRGAARIWLHATDAGRAVYSQLGFVPHDGYMIWDATVAADSHVRP